MAKNIKFVYVMILLISLIIVAAEVSGKLFSHPFEIFLFIVYKISHPFK